MSTPLEVMRRAVGQLDHRVRALPVLVLMPHGACDCRCVMCDIWRANAERRQLGVEEIESLLPDIRALGVRRVVLSGGEALLHANLWKLCELLRGAGTKITLLSTGMSLARHAAEVSRWCDEVILSLDGPPDVHDSIRRIEGCFEYLAAGAAALRGAGSSRSARCVLQRANLDSFAATIETARELQLDRISFLAVDVGSVAFNRARPWSEDRASDVRPTLGQVRVFQRRLEQLQDNQPGLFGGFVAESASKLAALGQYFLALHGEAEMPHQPRNAPWISAVIEANGDVRPCFFHPAYGNLRDGGLAGQINSPAAVDFRRGLDVRANPTCRACVCRLQLPPFASV